MYERFYSLFDRTNMLSSKQCGFGSTQSTKNALVVNKERSKQGSTDTFTCMFLDLRKTFVSINHETLSAKPEKNGSRGISSKWFE